MAYIHRFIPSDNANSGHGMNQSSDRMRVGVWDLEVNAGFLLEILNELNDCQSEFRFEMIDGSVPRSITFGGESTLDWARKRLGPKVVGKEESLRKNIVAGNVYVLGQEAIKDFGLDLVVLFTKWMIADVHDEKVIWNYFSVSERKCVIVSAADVREFAQKANRRFEVALASMMISQLVVELHPDKVGFYRECRGCMLDFNETRVTLVDTFDRLEFEPERLETIPEPTRSAAEKMTSVLRETPRP
ncbi:MAG: hypothetical protein AAFX81_13480 [Pseudomonadota bacterium]